MTESQELQGELITDGLAIILSKALGREFIMQNLEIVIRALDEFTSWRVLANSISKSSGLDYGYVYNEIPRAASTESADEDSLQIIVNNLRDHGFEDWLQE